MFELSDDNQKILTIIGLIIHIPAIFYAGLFIQQYVITGGIDDPGEQLSLIFLSISFLIYIIGFLFLTIGKLWIRDPKLGYISLFENLLYWSSFGIFGFIAVVGGKVEETGINRLLLIAYLAPIIIHTYWSVKSIRES